MLYMLNILSKLNADLNGKRIGLLKEGFDGCKPGVVDVVKKAGESLKTLGAVVEEVSLPIHSEGQAIWTPLIMDGGFETIVNRAGFGPSSKGFHDAHMMDHLTNSMRHSLNNASMPFKTVCLLGQYMKESNNYHYYCRASNLNMKLTKAYDEKLKEYDVLIMPTLPFVATKIPLQGASLKVMLEEAFGMVQNTAPFNATGHPALSINSGHVDGLPVGMMIVGKKWHEQDVLNVAYAYEKSLTK